MAGRGPGSLCWASDERHVFFVKTNGLQRELWRMPVDVGTAAFTGFSVIGKNLYFLRSHPDGRHIAFVAGGTRTAEVWALENFLH
jgi:hypothetical protein